MFYFPRIGHWRGERRSYAVDEGATARKGVRRVSEGQRPQAETDRLCKGRRAIAWQRQLRPGCSPELRPFRCPSPTSSPEKAAFGRDIPVIVIKT
jgi:hypothetical protein